jgi:phosphoglycolate phosphatase-like HAD superfamily hydrolase
LERETVKGSDVVFVGDEQRDMDAALQCGCHFVGVSTGSIPFDLQPLYTITDMSELEEILSRFD